LFVCKDYKLCYVGTVQYIVCMVTNKCTVCLTPPSVSLSTFQYLPARINFVTSETTVKLRDARNEFLKCYLYEFRHQGRDLYLTRTNR